MHPRDYPVATFLVPFTGNGTEIDFGSFWLFVTWADEVEVTKKIPFFTRCSFIIVNVSKRRKRMSQHSLNENIVTFSANSVYLCFQTRAYDYLNIFFRFQCLDKASDSVCEHLYTYINITDKLRVHISYVYLSKEKKVEAIWIASFQIIYN